MSIQNLYPNISPSLSLDFANVQQLDSRITFTRASTATYYGTQTAKAEENLLLQSQDFTTSWSNSSSSDTANTSVAPDGTTTADTITANAGTAITPLVFQGALSSTSGLDYVFSVFAKAGTYSVLQLTNINIQSPSAYANFDLSAGTVGTSANCTTSIQDVGSGWYRCIIVFSATATVTNGAMYAALSASTSANRFATWNPVGTETILLWGAQFEQRSAVTAYTPTTTQPITNYIPVLETAASGVARFDHNPTTFESLGLLIEESRTNLFTYSEQFDDAAWTKSQSSITANTIVAPDGTLTGDKLVENTATAVHSAAQSISGVSGTIYTITVYAKAAERTLLRLGSPSSIFGTGAVWQYDLTTGSVTTVTGTSGTSASAELVGNGWWRVRLTTIAATTTTTGSFTISLSTAGGGSYTGDGYSGVFIWGAQLESSSFSTSYIQTVASQVTRSSDSSPMTGSNFSSWFSNAEGTLYAELNARALAASSGIVLNDNTTNNRIRMALASTTDQGTVTTSGAAQAVLDGGTPAANTATKVAMAYAFNNFALSLNGGAAVTDTTGTVPVVSQLQIGAETTTVGNLHIKKVAFYPKRLLDAQLVALTT